AITINPAALMIATSSPLPSGTVGTVYSQSFAALGGTPPFSWSVVAGAIPAGLSLSSGGVLRGTPTTANTYNFTVRVSDSGGQFADKVFALTINPAALTITTPSPLPPGTVGNTYSQSFAASGGTQPL